MGLGSAIACWIGSALLFVFAYTIGWVALYAFNAAPVLGSMVVNYVIVLFLAASAAGAIIYAVSVALFGFAALDI